MPTPVSTASHARAPPARRSALWLRCQLVPFARCARRAVCIAHTPLRCAYRFVFAVRSCHVLPRWGETPRLPLARRPHQVPPAASSACLSQRGFLVYSTAAAAGSTQQASSSSRAK
jgi:hypothetical protein